MECEGAYYLCPLPQAQLAAGELETVWEAIERGDLTLSPVDRASPEGELQRIAEGHERQVQLTGEANGESPSWTERRLVVRSLRHAKVSEASLRTRVAKAQAQVEALNQRGRGRKRFEEIEELRQAATAIVQRHQVEDLLWLRYDQQCTSHPVRASCIFQPYGIDATELTRPAQRRRREPPPSTLAYSPRSRAEDNISTTPLK